MYSFVIDKEAAAKMIEEQEKAKKRAEKKAAKEKRKQEAADANKKTSNGNANIIQDSASDLSNHTRLNPKVHSSESKQKG